MLAGLAEVEPHPPAVHHLREVVQGPVVLALGGIDPARSTAAAVAAYDALVTYRVPEAHLIVVGPVADQRHRVLLQEVVRRSNLTAAWLAGEVDDAHLVAFLRRADVALVQPGPPADVRDDLLRAALFGLPVVGPADVVGQDGLGLAADDGPLVWAEALAAVLERPAVRTDLRARSRRLAAEAFAEPA